MPFLWRCGPGFAGWRFEPPRAGPVGLRGPRKPDCDQTVTGVSPSSSSTARDPAYFRGMALVLVAGVFMSIGGIGVRLIEAVGL